MFNRGFTSHFCGSTRHDHNRAVQCRDIVDQSNHVRIIKSFLQSDCYMNSHSLDGFSMASFSDISAPALPPDTLLPPRGPRPLATSAARLNHTPPAPRSGSARRSPPMSLRRAPPGRLTECFFEHRRPVVENEPGDGPAVRLHRAPVIRRRAPPGCRAGRGLMSRERVSPDPRSRCRRRARTRRSPSGRTGQNSTFWWAGSRGYPSDTSRRRSAFLFMVGHRLLLNQRWVS